MNRSSSFVLYLFLVSTIITLDQASKKWAFTILFGNPDMQISSWLNLSFAANRGISWGLFSSQSTYGFYFLTLLISTIIIAFAFYAIIQHLNKASIHLESFVVGGAISNIIDRMQYNFVIDFIDMHIGVWHWPTFNIADIFIVIGVLGLLFKELRKKYD